MFEQKSEAENLFITDKLLDGARSPGTDVPWKVLIVDSEKDSHNVIHCHLDRFIYEGREMKMLDAYSPNEGRQCLEENPDIALVLVGFCLEESDPGLLLVRHIRQEIANNAMRIVGCCDSAGSLPWEKVVTDFELSDLIEKKDLTKARLLTLVISALRSYRDITASYDLSRNLLGELRELRESVERLRASEEIYSAIFTHIGVGVTMISPEMEILYMNPIMERLNPLVDVKERPICYKSFNTPPRDDICPYCPVVRTFGDGKVHTSITDTPTESGILHYRVISTPVFARDGSVEAVVEVVEDITERKHAEGELRQKEIYLQGILEATADGILAVDEMGKVIRSNRNFAKLWRIPPELVDAADDKALLDYVLEQLMEPDAFLARVMSLYGTDRIEEDILLFKDGRIFERSSAPLLREETIIGRVWSFRDITEKRRMEEEVLHSQKLESVGILAGGIAHDFNNLLTAILGNISLAKMQIPREDKTQSRLNEAEKASLRARDLTQQLLTFAKGGAPVRRSASIVELIRETVGFALSGSNVRCDFDISEDINPVEIDEGQISQVIQNLIINADQAMPLGGFLKVSCHEKTLKDGEVAQLGAGRYIKISISDQGVGISPEHLQRIFDPYFTTKEKGRGLGLASSYSIIRNHDGHISVISRQGRGTTFTIHLPVISGPKGTKPAHYGSVITGSGKILVMDDEEAVLEVAGEILSYLGFEAVCAKNGEDALELYREVREAGDKFVAVIADLTIPGGMGGIDMVKLLLESDPEVRVIVSSGYNNDPIMSEYSSYGFSGVICKPYLVEDVSRVLAEVLAQEYSI